MHDASHEPAFIYLIKIKGATVNKNKSTIHQMKAHEITHLYTIFVSVLLKPALIWKFSVLGVFEYEALLW